MPSTPDQFGREIRNRPKRLPFLAMLLLVPVIGISGEPTTTLTPDEIIGSWQVATHDGQTVPPGSIWNFSTDGSLSIELWLNGAETRWYQGTWHMDSSTRPARLDFDLEHIVEGTVTRSRTGKAIASLEERQLTIAVFDVEGSHYPSSFELSPGVDLIVLTRVKDDAPGPDDQDSK